MAKYTIISLAHEFYSLYSNIHWNSPTLKYIFLSEFMIGILRYATFPFSKSWEMESELSLANCLDSDISVMWLTFHVRSWLNHVGLRPRSWKLKGKKSVYRYRVCIKNNQQEKQIPKAKGLRLWSTMLGQYSHLIYAHQYSHLIYCHLINSYVNNCHLGALLLNNKQLCN